LDGELQESLLQDIIPPDSFKELQTHLREGVLHAEAGWEAGSEDEDTLTGDFGGSLRTHGWIDFPQSIEPWQWRITYKKFRGRGGGAPEKVIGADGIVVVEVHLGNGGLMVSKGVLFQSKKAKGSSRGDMLDQVRRMEQTAPGGSAVFEFGPGGYRGASGRDILSAKEQQLTRIPHPEYQLGDYLAEQFLPCKSGLRGMYYDAVRENIVVPV
jgi:hypothetical protein